MVLFPWCLPDHLSALVDRPLNTGLSYHMNPNDYDDGDQQSLIEALYTLTSPPVVSFKAGLSSCSCLGEKAFARAWSLGLRGLGV